MNLENTKQIVDTLDSLKNIKFITNHHQSILKLLEDEIDISGMDLNDRINIITELNNGINTILSKTKQKLTEKLKNEVLNINEQ